MLDDGAELREQIQEIAANFIKSKFERRLAAIHLLNDKKFSKVKVVRPGTFVIAEYDLQENVEEKNKNIEYLRKNDTLQNEGWTFVEIEMPHKFLKQSRHVFLDLDNLILIGGLDDTHRDTNSFYTNYCY